ncbi:Coiled-coil domain-containing protein 25 [Merluccius polli]|uniref:Coiled-coil domain-containing protein 25 n=1 Tax=Merluccius polli TaxID=89951 RepID=A0AA47N520_MERPO|nr:Coiled-coil domain-containing protein 25 [Merluccius polli]
MRFLGEGLFSFPSVMVGFFLTGDCGTLADLCFKWEVVNPAYTIYMGKDKYENEDLIKYGWPEDIWFHVDKLSSAHVYLRMPKGLTIADIPKEVLIDCAQLVKNNSIQGCKMNNINVVYTPWANLKKTGEMDVGQIGFFRQKEVKLVAVEKKINEIVNRLEKTKDERHPDLAAERESRDQEERNEKKAQLQEQKKREKDEVKRKKEMEELRNYTSLMTTDNMTTNEGSLDVTEFVLRINFGRCRIANKEPCMQAQA